MGELNFCTIHDIAKISFERLISDLSSDQGLFYLLSRFYHNKLFVPIFMSLRCYFLYFDLWQLAKFVPRVLIPFVLYAFWEKRLRKFFVVIQLLLPLMFILNPLGFSLGQKITSFSLYYSTLGIVGLIKLLTRRNGRTRGEK